VNDQIRQLIIAYVATAVPFVGALLMLRAEGRAYFRWPVYSVMVMVLGVVLQNVIHRRLPPEWNFTHTALLYYGALTLYALLGLGAGLLLGTLTQRKTPDVATAEQPDEPQPPDR